MSDATRTEEDLRAAEMEMAEAEEAAAAVSSAAAEEALEQEAQEQEAEEEKLAPEDRARRLFASYLEVPETEKEEIDEAEEEVTLTDLLDEEETELLGEEEEEAGEEEAEEGEPDAEGRNWFVVHSYSGYENKVKKNLEHRIASLGMQHKIFEVVVPTEEEIELKDGQRRKVERRIFPGYILVDMIMDEDSWYVVRNTPGVTGFVGSIRKPTPLRKRDVDKILKRMRAETPRVTVTFRPGQKVRIADGPFEDFVGTVDEIYPDKGKVRILVSFFGRETPVELDFLQVEKIT
jgi:transcriptional antiterminator NusG